MFATVSTSLNFCLYTTAWSHTMLCVHKNQYFARFSFALQIILGSSCVMVDFYQCLHQFHQRQRPPNKKKENKIKNIVESP